MQNKEQLEFKRKSPGQASCKTPGAAHRKVERRNKGHAISVDVEVRDIADKQPLGRELMWDSSECCECVLLMGKAAFVL